MSTGPSAAVRQIVLERDQYRCVSCGASIHGQMFSLHHRIPRGMGGSKDPRLNLPSNLLTLCGSGTTGCHGWVESNRTTARAWGYLLWRTGAPATNAVYTADGYAWFRDDGSIDPVPPPNVSAERLADLARDAERGRLERIGQAA